MAGEKWKAGAIAAVGLGVVVQVSAALVPSTRFGLPVVLAVLGTLLIAGAFLAAAMKNDEWAGMPRWGWGVLTSLVLAVGVLVIASYVDKGESKNDRRAGAKPGTTSTTKGHPTTTTSSLVGTTDTTRAGSANPGTKGPTDRGSTQTTAAPPPSSVPPTTTTTRPVITAAVASSTRPFFTSSRWSQTLS